MNLNVKAAIELTLNLNERDLNQVGMKFYPNPVSTVLRVHIQDIAKYDYAVYTINGAGIFSGTSSNKQVGIDVSGLLKGVYILKIRSEDANFISKFIVK